MTVDLVLNHMVATVDLDPRVDRNEWCITCHCGQQFTGQMTLANAIDSYGNHLVNVGMDWGRTTIHSEIHDRNPDPDPGPVYPAGLVRRILDWFGFTHSPTQTPT